MSKVINIGGRLHSTEQGNILTGANEILDDTKGKKQNVINSETDAELLRLEQSKQDNLTFDNAPTENSNNPVKSGGVYAADKTLSDAIEAILLLIPSAATALNQLADKAFVNSSVSTNTATFRGTYNVVTDLELAYDATHEQIAAKLGQIIANADNNDYSFVQIPVSATSTNIRRTERYKFNGTAWGFEYDLNTSGFTAAQWEAINSGITALLVLKLSELPTATELATALAGKQATLTFDNVPTSGSDNPVKSGGIYDALATKQSTLTFDDAPAENSNNPVKSGGIYTAIKTVADALSDVNDLIPSEATDLNQLADKIYVLAKILEATPAFKGQFVTLGELQAVASPKAGDLGIVRTKDNDGLDVFTFYQYLNNTWNVFFTLQHHPQIKPATTGTTGDYPYNGMGRVTLKKNMVNGVNTLTQDMFYKDGPGNTRVPNTNTIFEVPYEFELAEDITIPANCVLEFKGGSISGAYTITLNGTKIVGKECINSILAGTIYNSVVDADIFGPQISDLNILISCFNIAGTIYLKHNKTYSIGENSLTLSRESHIYGNNAHIVSLENGIVTQYPLYISNTKITANITAISLLKTDTDGVSKAIVDGCVLNSATVSMSPVTYAIGACCHDLTIRNCKLSGGYLTVGAQGDYYTIKAGSTFMFVGNEVFGTAADLLQINSFSKGLVSENKFIESVNNSIAVSDSNNIDICNNEFYEFGTSDSHWGIALSYGADKCRVFGNYLTTSHAVSGGICSDLYRPNDEGKTLGYNVIQSNTIKFTVAGQNGIVLNGSDYSTVKDNYIENSTVRGVGAEDSVQAIIENNAIVQKGGTPINITGGSLKTIVSHNDIKCTADSSCGTGISINNSNGSIVLQNTIDWTSQNSVQFMFTCSKSDCDFVSNVVNMRNSANGRVFAMGGKDNEVANIFIYKNVFKSLSGGVHWLIDVTGPMDIKSIGNIYQEPDASVVVLLTTGSVTYSFNDYVNGAAYTATN